VSTLPLGRRIILNGLSERTFREQVRHWAEARGWTVYFTWSSRNSPAGFPDLVLLRPPRLLIAELKTQTGKTTRAQDRWLGLLGLVPCVEVHLWRPWDEQQIMDILA